MKGKDKIAPSDADLILLARRDSNEAKRRRAISLLLERYQDRVYFWCYRMVRDHERSLDLAQEVLLIAYRKLDSFEGRSEFASWLFVVARNRCLSAVRQPSPIMDETELDEILDPAGGPDRQLEEKLDEESLLSLVRTHLDKEEQQVLWLRCIERLPVEEITNMLELGGASGARGVLQRARRKLRAALALREGGGPRPA